MQDIDIRLIIQIIASSVSLIGIILGFLFTWKENKRGRYVERITNQTINNMLFLRENSASFLMLTRPEMIKEDESEMRYKRQLMQAAVNIESIMKYRFPREKQIIDLVRSLTKRCIQYYDKPSEKLSKEIRKDNNDFYLLMTVYDYADWRYIKAQARTSPYKEYPDYDKIYDEQNKAFTDSDRPKEW